MMRIMPGSAAQHDQEGLGLIGSASPCQRNPMSGASLNRLVFTSITLQVDGPHDPHRGVDDGGQEC